VLLQREVRHADEPDLARLLQFDHRPNLIGDWHPPGGVVELVEVHAVDPHVLQAFVDGLVDDLGRSHGLAGEENLVPPALHGLADDPLRVAIAESRCRVDPVDPRVQRGLDRADGLLVLDRAFTLPRRAPIGPRA